MVYLHVSPQNSLQTLNLWTPDWSVLTRHIKIPLSFMKMQSCTVDKMSASIQLLDRQRQFGHHPTAGLANLWVNTQQSQSCFLAGQMGNVKPPWTEDCEKGGWHGETQMEEMTGWGTGQEEVTVSGSQQTQSFVAELLMCTSYRDPRSSPAD